MSEILQRTIPMKDRGMVKIKTQLMANTVNLGQTTRVVARIGNTNTKLRNMVRVHNKVRVD